MFSVSKSIICHLSFSVIVWFYRRRAHVLNVHETDSHKFCKTYCNPCTNTASCNFSSTLELLHHHSLTSDLHAHSNWCLQTLHELCLCCEPILWPLLTPLDPASHSRGPPTLSWYLLQVFARLTAGFPGHSRGYLAHRGGGGGYLLGICWPGVWFTILMGFLCSSIVMSWFTATEKLLRCLDKYLFKGMDGCFTSIKWFS